MTEPVLRVQDLAVYFSSQTGGLLRREERVLRAVDGISFDLNPGETLGIVGESGSGKSTLARAILGLLSPNRGRVLWMGEDLTRLEPEAMRQKRKELQIVFQDPVASLNPRMTAGAIIAEPLWTFYPPDGELAGRGTHPGHDENGGLAAQPDQPLSARIFRWTMPAHRHCTFPGAQSEAADLR